MKYNVNPIFETKFKPFVLDIKKYFFDAHDTIHKARNELKIISYNEIDTVVKSFKTPHFLNRIVYTFFRDTKAKKSFEYSLKIADFTPNPIGYIEFYESYLLKESFFISEEFKYDFTIREPLLDSRFVDRDEILRTFARFTYALHEAEILHQDYSPGNILIKKENTTYTFKVVDINRMEFRPLSLDERLKNFNKLWANDEDIETIATEYAKISKEEKEKCVQIAQDYNTKHKNKINMKKRLKGIPVVD